VTKNKLESNVDRSSGRAGKDHTHVRPYILVSIHEITLYVQAAAYHEGRPLVTKPQLLYSCVVLLQLQ
jgi:hypothetical protein